MTLPIKVVLNHTKRDDSPTEWRKLACGHRIKVVKHLKGRIRCPECPTIRVTRGDS